MLTVLAGLLAAQVFFVGHVDPLTTLVLLVLLVGYVTTDA